MYYRIDAIDSWFFRNAAPFDAGVNTYGKSIFPPFPSVYAGALRNCAVPIPNPNSPKNTFARRLKIGWNGIIIDKHMLFPLPLDLYITKSGDEKFIAHEMVISSAAGSSFPLPYFLKSPTELKKPPHISGGAYVDENVIKAYLNAQSSDYSVYSLGDYFSEETHIGIRIDPLSGTVADGQFYQQTLITPKNNIRQCSLAIETSGIEIPEKSIVHIGGDGKLGVISRIGENLSLPDPPSIENDSCFKLYLATPAIFEKGWLPGWINRENMTGIFTHKKHSVRVKLLSAVVGKPVAIGGFGVDKDKDKNKNKDKDKDKICPREMRYAVPAGSVYYFKLLSGSMTDVIRLFHKKCISDYRETLGFHYEKMDRLRYCSRGFGYSLVGSIGKNQRGEVHNV